MNVDDPRLVIFTLLVVRYIVRDFNDSVSLNVPLYCNYSTFESLFYVFKPLQYCEMRRFRGMEERSCPILMIWLLSLSSG